MSRRNPIPDDVWDQHVAILAKPGRGKTVTAKGGAERLLRAGIRCGAIDPTAAWWGMRLKADGKTQAFPMVIFGGDHADIPITQHMGEKVGTLCATADWSFIIDISKMGGEARTEFMTAFAEALFAANRRRLNLFMDECHLYMPQQRQPGRKSAAMTVATTNLVSGGRGIGLCVTMISQRSAKVHKDALTAAETMIALGMVAPQDNEAVARWVKIQGDTTEAKKMLASLPGGLR
jgi:DNA helicase HerA-like ATPase